MQIWHSVHRDRRISIMIFLRVNFLNYLIISINNYTKSKNNAMVKGAKSKSAVFPNEWQGCCQAETVENACKRRTRSIIL